LQKTDFNCNLLLSWKADFLTKEFLVRYPETQSRVTAETVCRPKNRILHHENPPAAESNLLDDVLDLQTRNWEHLWIDIGGEG
jgi:hypothetical protein